MAPACDLIRGLRAKQVLADRAYDAHSLHDVILDQGGEPVIPPRRHRRFQHSYDRIAYKQRWGIEAFFAKLKQWRRIAPAAAILRSCASPEPWAAPPDTTNSPPTSSASSNLPASCSGSND